MGIPKHLVEVPVVPTRQPVGLSGEVLEANTGRELTANGTFTIVATGTKIVLHKLFIFDPSDSGGTMQIQNGAGSRIVQISAVNQGQFELFWHKLQSSDDSAGVEIDGLIVVLANCTGTFSMGVGVKGI